MSGPSPIYLDHAATTPLAPEVVAVMQAVLADPMLCANPASATHAAGRRAAERVASAREEIARVVGASPGEIVFTSGATESDNLAVLGVARASAWRGRHLVSSRTEHRAVLDALEQLEREGFSVTRLDPGPDGRVDPDALAGALREDTVLVSLMHVNNETGAVNDIAELGALCRDAGIPFHVDAAQSIGKLPIDFHALPVDLLSINAHKVHGPKGIGALVLTPAARRRIEPLLFGGGQEGGLRPGTLATHQVVGMARALVLAEQCRETEYARLQGLRLAFREALATAGGVLCNSPLDAHGSPWILNVSFEGVVGESLRLALEGMAVSGGSACNSASGEGSYVLRALGRSDLLAEAALRFSFGRDTDEALLARAAVEVRAALRRLRRMAPIASAPPVVHADRASG